MVLLPAPDLERPVELLQEDYPRQGVGQGYGSEGETFVGPTDHLRREPQRTAEHESDVAAARDTQGVEFLRQARRGECFSTLPIKGHHVGPRWNTLEEALPFRRQHLVGGAAVHVLFPDLDDLDGKVVPEPGEVIITAFGSPPSQPTDGDDGGAPDRSISKSRSDLLGRS